MAKIEFGGSGLQEAASLRRAADRKEKQARDLLSSHEDQQKCDEQMKAFEPRLHFAIFFDLSFPMIFGQLSMIVFHVSEFQSSLAYWKMSPSFQPSIPCLPSDAVGDFTLRMSMLSSSAKTSSPPSATDPFPS